MDELEETRERNTQPRAAVQLDFTGTGRRTKKLLVTRHLGKALGGHTLFRDLNLTLTSGMRLGVLGRNGSGKTTLLRLLTGTLPPDERRRLAGRGSARSVFRPDTASAR